RAVTAEPGLDGDAPAPALAEPPPAGRVRAERAVVRDPQRRRPRLRGAPLLHHPRRPGPSARRPRVRAPGVPGPRRSAGRAGSGPGPLLRAPLRRPAPRLIGPDLRASVLREQPPDVVPARLPVERAEHLAVRDVLGGGREHLELELAAGELRAGEVPHRLEQ